MTKEHATQESLFEDPLGLRLRAARERAGLGVEQVGQQLKLPVAVVEAMEREDWARLGARIYVRSYLGSYLRLLGLPEMLANQVGAEAQPSSPPLVTLATRSRMRHTLDTSLRNVVYLVMTAVLVVPVYLVASRYQARERVQDLTLETDQAELDELVAQAPVASPPSAPAVAGPATPAVVEAPAPLVATAPPAVVADAAATGAHADPVLASLAPFQGGGDGALVLSFRGESWIDVVDAQGRRVERGLVAAGGERRYEPGQVGRVTLGNADVVDVRHAGQPVDLAPFRAANVARFAVSSDGEPAPAGH